MTSPTRPIAEHLHHAVNRMPSTLVLGDLEQHVDRFRFDRQAGRHLEQTQAIAVHVFPLSAIDEEPSVFLVVAEEELAAEGGCYGVYATRALAEEAIAILERGSRRYKIEEEPLRGAVDPILLVDGEEG